MNSQLHRIILALVAGVLASAEIAGASVDKIAFSNPSQPRVLELRLGLGLADVTVEGADTNEVRVASEAGSTPRRSDGLRALAGVSEFSLTEKGNVVTLEAPPYQKSQGRGEYRLVVPRDVTLVVAESAGGDIRCARLSGDIEIATMHGAIRLEDVTGGVVVSTMNGEIHADFRELRDGKPISLTSVHGTVVVRVPETARASVRLRSTSGDILSDFDPKVLVTETQVSPASSVSMHFMAKGADGKTSSASASASASNDGIQEKPRRGRTMPSPEPPPGPSAFRIPVITGGKSVVGQLNGGGPEISVATMKGDVILRRLEAGK